MSCEISFSCHLNPLTVINQMQIHGILCADRVMGSNGIRNLTVDLDGFFQQCASGGLYKQRNRAVDHRNQSWNYNVFAAQGNGCMKIYIFLCMVFMFP